MPSLTHEALVELVRETPSVLIDLLQSTKLIDLPAHDGVVSVAESLGEVLPRELRCDSLFCFEQHNKPVLAAVVEVQLNEDPDKPFTWPAYVVGARLRFRCDAILVVLTLTERVAAWARRPIVIGPGAGAVQPLVLGPREMPPITDVAQAMKSPELAALSAIAHGHDADVNIAVAVATTAMRAIMTALKGDKGAMYYDLVYAALSDAARKAFDMLPASYEYQHEGLRKAKAEGMAEGKAEGILAVLQVRGLEVSDAQRKRILATTDNAELNEWLRASVTASSTDALFSH